MKIGDKVKVFTQVGLMKKPEWLRGTLVEDGVAEVHGNRIATEYGKVKLWKPIPHDDTGCPKVREFALNQWEELKQVVTNAVRHFLPEKEVKFDDQEKTVEVEGVTLYPDHKEMETIAEFREIPCWTASYWVTTYSRTEPPDADEVVCGHAFNATQAARILIDSVLKNRADDYWQGVADEQYSRCLED